MGAFDNFLVSVKSTLEGTVPYGGTIVPTSNEFPTMLAQHIRGGYMPLPDLETLADLPIEMMQKDMTVVVSEHLRPNGSLHTRTKYYLKIIPSDRLSIINESILGFWSVEDVSTAQDESTIAVQYAPNYNGKRPLFLPTEITSAAYQAGYPSDATFAGGNPSDIIWADSFDPAKNHAWVRQRIGIQPWGIPVSITAGGDYEQNQYIDVIFKWVNKGDQSPARPIQPNDYNVLPIGWMNTPGNNYDILILTQDLYRSQALRSPYGVLKSNWDIPILVSSNPSLVRYGNTPGNKDFLNNTFWRGYYTPGLDTHMATRSDVGSTDWTLTRIDGENGEYTDFVFKLFPISASIQDIIDGTPTLTVPIGGTAPNDWSDGPVAGTDTEIQYFSISTKFPDGSLKTSWSIPRRFDGMDTFNVVIEENPGDTFYSIRDGNGNLIDTIAAITLTPKLFKGITEISDGLNSFKWYRGTTLIQFDPTTFKAVNLGIALNTFHSISPDGKVLTINPNAVNNTQQYKIAINHVTRPGSDYIKTIQIKDASDDGNTFLTDIGSVNGSTFKNQNGLYQFDGKFFKGGLSDVSGVVFSWSIKNATGTVLTNGLRDSGGSIIGDTNVMAPRVFVQGSDIDQYAFLILTATFGSITRTDTITLTDVQDAAALEVLYWGLGASDPGNPTDFTPRTKTKAEVLSLGIGYLDPSDAAGAWYRIERVGGIWGAELKVRAETSNPNGGINVLVWKNVTAPTIPPTPAVPGSGTIVPNGWTLTSTDFVGTEDTTYLTSCLFLLRTDFAADPTVLTRDNYTPAGNFGVPKKIQQPGGGAGIDGKNGWSPLFSQEVDGNRVVMKLADWTGGTGNKPAGAGGSNSYLGTNGLTSLANAINLRGPSGNNSYVPASLYQSGSKVTESEITIGTNNPIQIQFISIPSFNQARIIKVKGSVKLRSDSNGFDDTFRISLYYQNAVGASGEVAYTIFRPFLSAANRGQSVDIEFTQSDAPPSFATSFSLIVELLSGGLAKRDDGYLEVLVIPQ